MQLCPWIQKRIRRKIPIKIRISMTSMLMNQNQIRGSSSILSLANCSTPDWEASKLVVSKHDFQQNQTFITRGITPKPATTGGAQVRGIAPKQNSPEETSQRWQVVGDTVFNFAGPEMPRPPVSLVVSLPVTPTGQGRRISKILEIQ